MIEQKDKFKFMLVIQIFILIATLPIPILGLFFDETRSYKDIFLQYLLFNGLALSGKLKIAAFVRL